MKYCPKCGNTGVLITGEPCDCQLHIEDIYNGVECLDIPESYRGLKFDPIMLPSVMGMPYMNHMATVYEQIVSLRWKCRNMVICSPNQTGKSVLAYCTIQELFRKEIQVFPLFDILEIKRIMTDIEYNKHQSLGVDNPMRLYTAPYVFAVIPPMTNYDTYDTAAMLVARRTRRGNSTILLYDGSWNQLIYNDSKGSLKGLEGDGSLTTVAVSSWVSKEVAK